MRLELGSRLSLVLPSWTSFETELIFEVREIVLLGSTMKDISFIIIEFSFHAEKKKFIVWRSENLFSCPRAGKQAVFQL